MIGDATLFSRTDLVEAAWRVAQPMLDVWSATTPADFPNYPYGSWGPTAAFDLIENDGRRWVEVFNRSALEKVPLFQGSDPVLLHNMAMMLKPAAFDVGDAITRKGEVGSEMYFICRGEVEVVDGAGKRLATLSEGDFFGELSLLTAEPRIATVKATTACDVFVLDKADFNRVLRSDPKFDTALRAIVKTRYASVNMGEATK
jgi:glucose-6-phosphate 1-dehydrogenase